MEILDQCASLTPEQAKIDRIRIRGRPENNFNQIGDEYGIRNIEECKRNKWV